jgi:curved DNA-binding protein CbpA
MSDDTQDVPYYLMPVAAIVGSYALFLTLKALGQIYQVATFDAKKTPTKIPPPSLISKQFFGLIASIVGCVLTYGYICARVNNALGTDVFDPFEILNIASSANSTVIKSAYRQLSKQHHPDKGGDASVFQKINLAYKSLTDDVARENYERYGHPDGPQTSTLDFALPDWLLHPEGSVALILVLLYIGMFITGIVYLVRWGNQAEAYAKKASLDNSVAQSDMAYLANHLRPNSTHREVLYYIATCPESVSVTQQNLNAAEDLKKARLEYLNPKKKVEPVVDDFDMDDGGWADDDDEDEAAKAHKAKQEEKEKLAKEVAAASGQEQMAKMVKLEGVDDGVLGQTWVETTLKGTKLSNMTFVTKAGKSVSALDHPAIRRNLCMTLGRLNAQKLNTHPELRKYILCLSVRTIHDII